MFIALGVGIDELLQCDEIFAVTYTYALHSTAAYKDEHVTCRVINCWRKVNFVIILSL